MPIETHVDAPERTVQRRAVVVSASWMALTGVGSLLATQLVGTPIGLVAVLQSFTPWLPIVTLAVAVAAQLVRADAVGTAAAVLTIGTLAVLGPVAFPDHLPDPAPDATPLTVVAANILYTNDDLDGVARTLRAVDADLVALLEVTPATLAGLARLPVADDYPHRIERPEEAAFGIAIWSRYPLTPVSNRGARGTPIEVDVDHPDSTIRVVAAHPPPPVTDHDGWRTGVEQLPNLADPARTAGPIVVLGDFNASWFHPPFRRAISDAALVDAAAATGNGLAMTWPSHPILPAFVTIDHVLFSDGLTALGTDVVAIPGSDHHAVVAELAVAASSER